MGGYSFQLEYSIFSPKSKVHFMQPILKRVGCFFIDRREVKCLNYRTPKLGAGTAVLVSSSARGLDGLYGYSIKIISVFFF